MGTLRLLWVAESLATLGNGEYHPFNPSEGRRTVTAERRNLGSGAPARPVAVVNNERITLEEFFNTYQAFLTRWDSFIQKDPEKKEEIKIVAPAVAISEDDRSEEIASTSNDAPESGSATPSPPEPPVVAPVEPEPAAVVPETVEEPEVHVLREG